MRRSLAVEVCVCAFCVVIASGVAWSGERDYDSIASKIVNVSAAVQPGEVVVIQGNPDQMTLLEALVVATWKAGGQPTVEVVIPSANRRAVTEIPIEYMKYPQWYTLAQTRLVDCFINVASIEDPTLFADVPEEIFEAFRDASRPLQRAQQLARFRSVALGQTGGVPTVAYAKSMNVDYETMQQMFWNAVDTDYEALRNRATVVAATMKPGAEVHVTSDAGTDLKFVIDDVPSRINCGRVDDNQVSSGPMLTWLPAGEAFAAVKAGSGDGTLIIPSMRFRGMPVKDVRATFSNGRLTSLSAGGDGSDALQTLVDTLSDDSMMLSVVDVGVNPDSQPIADSDYASWEMGGMVSLATGNNDWTGGSNSSVDGLTFYVHEASIDIGGTTICSKGDLKIGD
jgi:leucyl aminopeptidase (aminopeptidase T)